jgi:uncharacterized protein YqfA (UPF0365 family)
MPNANLLIPLVAAILGLVVVLALFFLMIGLFRLWFQGILAGVNVLVFDLIAMKLRRIDAALVMKCLILARQSGVELSHVELQRAYLQGADLEKLTLAHITAQKQQLGATFEELVASELQDRLAEKLKR